MHEQTRRLVSGCRLSNNKIHIFTSVPLRVEKKKKKKRFYLFDFRASHLFQVALAPALLCWVPLSLPHSSASPPVIPPLSLAAELLACERSVRLEDEPPPPSLSLLWRLLEIRNTDRKGVIVSAKTLESPLIF